MKQLKDYLHLYLGCEVMLFTEATNPKVKPQRATMVGTSTFRDWEIEYRVALSLGAKPILRPLSDMTEEEETEYTSIVDQWNFGFRRNMLAGASSTKYLLSKHFDLFNLIEAGCAIDKTKIKETE